MHTQKKIYAKSCFIISRLKASKDAARLYVSGNELNKMAPEYLKVLFPRLSLGFEGMNVFTPTRIVTMETVLFQSPKQSRVVIIVRVVELYREEEEN